MNFDEMFAEEQVDNPVEFYFEWKGGADTAAFTWYNKDKEERVSFKELRFMVLATMNTVRGYDEANQCGIYANEVADLRYQKLSVKSKKGGTIAEGLWGEIKDAVSGRGGKFCKAVYAVLLNEKKGTCAPICLHLYGSALAPLFEANIQKSPRIVTASVDPTEQKKGATKYYQPSFVKGKAIEDQDLKKQASEAGAKILAYLDHKKKQASEYEQANAMPSKSTDQSFSQMRDNFTQSVAPALTEKEIPSENETDDLPF